MKTYCDNILHCMESEEFSYIVHLKKYCNSDYVPQKVGKLEPISGEFYCLGKTWKCTVTEFQVLVREKLEKGDIK